MTEQRLSDAERDELVELLAADALQRGLPEHFARESAVVRVFGGDTKDPSGTPIPPPADARELRKDLMRLRSAKL